MVTTQPKPGGPTVQIPKSQALGQAGSGSPIIASQSPANASFVNGAIPLRMPEFSAVIRFSSDGSSLREVLAFAAGVPG